MNVLIRNLTAALILSLGVTGISFGQAAYNEEQFRAFDGKGNAVTIDEIVNAIGQTDVVFLGELHDDAVGHAVQAEIFRRTVEQYGAKRRVALSLEMFERDTQIVVNEYLNGQITENHFMSSSRPWPNYKTDYRSMVELAKEKRLAVIAANAPRRYINMVSRNGRAALNSLTKPAKEWMAPLPFGEPSAAYAAKFKALMGPSPEAQMGIDNILASQSLWDATMAHSVAKYLKSNRIAPDEGHGFARPVNNMAMLAATEKFLAKHIGGRYQETMTPEVAQRLTEITVDPKNVVIKDPNAPTVSSGPTAAGSLNGKWTLLADAGGQVVSIAVDFKQTAADFTGTTISQIGNGTITGGKVNGKEFTATLNADVQGQAVVFAMAGTIDGDKMSGTVSNPGFGSIPFTATKDK